VEKNNIIPPELEKQIQGFERAFSRFDKTWNHAGLKEEVSIFLNKHVPHGDQVDKLSNRFARMFHAYYLTGRYLEADYFWDLPLELYAEWENTNKKRVARGSPYYFRGMSAIAYRSIDRGFLFFHLAFEDDINEGFIPNKKVVGNHSPAWLFVTFGYSDPRQAAGEPLKRRADWLAQILLKYQQSNRGTLSMESLARSLSLEALGEKVLEEKQLIETTFSFTYNVFKSENLTYHLQQFPSVRFASQLALDILFSLCRIGEMWLVKKQGEEQGLLKSQLAYFFEKHHSDIKGEDLGKYNGYCITDFEKCLEKLLLNEQVLEGKNIEPWEFDLILIYVLRNEASHSATSSLVISERFSDLLERVFFGLFKIVETLYA
jgi:hypothetical protein